VNVGRDPRDFVLYIYGGAGGMHAPALAQELGIRTMVLPLSDLASGWSAFGVAASEAVSWEEESTPMPDPFPADVLNEIWAELEARATAGIASHGIDTGGIVLERFAEIRYRAQINNVRVRAPDGRYDAAVVEQLVRDFETEYERLLGKGVGYAGAGFFLNSLTVRARAPMFDLKLLPASDLSTDAPEPIAHRDVIWYEGGLEPRSTPVYDGARLTPGATISGPAIAEFTDTTLVLRHGQWATANAYGNVVVESDA
jgi:N-methylhydantoinase A